MSFCYAQQEIKMQRSMRRETERSISNLCFTSDITLRAPNANKCANRNGLHQGGRNLCVTLFTLIPLSSTWNSSDVQTIRKNGVLSSNYDRLVRPSKITNVSVALNLLTINYMVMYINISTQFL